MKSLRLIVVRNQYRLTMSKSSDSAPVPCARLTDAYIKTGRNPVPGPEGYLDLGDGGMIGYFPRKFLNSAELFHQLEDEIHWDHRTIRLFGKDVNQPRLVAYMANSPSLQYTYSHTTFQPDAYTPVVLKVKKLIEEFVDFEFNCVLCNLYRNGLDHMGWHSDNESVFGTDPIIASVSFGQLRAFDIRKNSNPKFHIRYMLGEGDVVIMKGSMQNNWKHAVIKTKQVHTSRINLTFRKMVYLEDQAFQQSNHETNSN